MVHFVLLIQEWRECNQLWTCTTLEVEESHNHTICHDWQNGEMDKENCHWLPSGTVIEESVLGMARIIWKVPKA